MVTFGCIYFLTVVFPMLFNGIFWASDIFRVYIWIVVSLSCGIFMYCIPM
jgi:hypothetical protein